MREGRGCPTKSFGRTVFNECHSGAGNAGLKARMRGTPARMDYGKLRHLVVVNRNAVAGRAATLAAERAAGAEAPVGAEEPPRRVSNSAELLAAKTPGTNGNFDVLRQVIAEGRMESDLIPSFPVDQLGQRENFVTLLHCFGLLSIQGVVDGRLRLGVPNQTVRRLMYGYLRDA